MYRAVIIAALVCGAVSVPFEALNDDSLSLPDFKLNVGATEVTFTEGKVEGLSNSVPPNPPCYGRYTCDVEVSGLRFTFNALANEPEKRSHVVVDLLHGVLTVHSKRTHEGNYATKSATVGDLNVSVREPWRFSDEPRENAHFEGLLRFKIAEFTKALAYKELFSERLNKALGLVPNTAEFDKKWAPVPGKPFDAVLEDHVALPDFEFSVSERQLKFSNGKAGPLSEVLKPGSRSHGDYELVVPLAGLKFFYRGVATNTEEKFNLEVEVLEGTVELVRVKDADGGLKVDSANVQNLKFYVEYPTEFSDDQGEQTLFEEKVKEKLSEVLKTFASAELFDKTVLENAAKKAKN
uniref:Uncharacterized protein n=1 Tax=Ornithodoros moubata TaxID=6938 RepID=Q6PRC9_ORNMO|nr:unknown secreted protein DS-1 precursor [Ornithodoros moubata]